MIPSHDPGGADDEPLPEPPPDLSELDDDFAFDAESTPPAGAPIRADGPGVRPPRPERIDRPITPADLDKALTRFGHDSFRPGQREAIGTLLDVRRLLLVAPTGGGKSLSYQLPACVLPGTTLVISPLISLMNDQVAGLEQHGIAATFLASTLDTDELRRRMRGIAEGAYDLAYVAPERLGHAGFRSLLSDMDCPLVAIDEAHCISEWGHDFRPEYMLIGEVVQQLTDARILACTATATPVVRDEIIERLHLPADTPQMVRGFARPNLALAVHEVNQKKERCDRVDEALFEALGGPGTDKGCAIVYAPTRRTTDQEAERLGALGWAVDSYHAGLPSAARERAQSAFLGGRLEVVVATNAFGMGIDRPDVRAVVHLAPPGSMEAYYQEVGRAGRDGEPAVGRLLVSPGDLGLRRRLIEGDGSRGDADFVQHRWGMFLELLRWAEGGSCRHDAILRYFGDEDETLSGCGHCDVCLGQAECMAAEPDEVALIVRKALSGVARIHGRFGLSLAAKLLKGARDDRLQWSGLADTSTHGVLSDHTEEWIGRLLRRCLSAGWVELTDGEYPMAVLTGEGQDVMYGKREARLLLPPRVRPRAGSKASRPSSSGSRRKRTTVVSDDALVDLADVELFEALREHRLDVARELGKPPYVVASDRTLRDIVRLKPSDLEGLCAAHGIGASKAESYGEGLLSVVARFTGGAGAWLLAATLAVLAGACGVDSGPDEPGADQTAESLETLCVVRLLDEPLDPSTERAFDPLDDAALRDHATIEWATLDLGAEPEDLALLDRDVIAAMGAELPDPQPGPRHADGPSGRLLAVRPGQGAVASVAVPPGAPLHVDVVGAGAVDGAVMVVPLDEMPRPGDLADPAWLASVMVRESVSLLPDGAGRLGAFVPAEPSTRSLLLVAVALRGPVLLGELRVGRTSALATALFGGSRTPRPRGVLIDEVAFDSLVIPGEGRIAWRVTLPEQAPRLRAALAPMGATMGLSVRWTVEAQGEVRTGVWALDDEPGWSREILPLTDLGGVDVVLRMEVEADASFPPRAPPAVAIGAPRVTGEQPSGSRAPDVIVVSLDTLREDRLHDPESPTPHLRRLAAEGVDFMEAVSTSSWTLPAHASLFTGRWPPTHGATRQSRRLAVPPQTLLAPAFRAAGYRTVAVTGGGFVSPSFGLSVGFEEYGVLDPCQPGPDDQGRVVREPRSRKRLLSLVESPGRRPLFLFVHTYAAHSWGPLPEEMEAQGLPGGAGPGLRERVLARDPRLRGDDVVIDPDADAALAQELNRLYDASASAADALVGDLVAALERSGRLDDTILVVLSDHGQEILERGLVGHGHGLHTELVRVPLVLRAPGLAPAVIDTPVSLVDVAPTLRALAGLAPDPGVEGRSLLPLLTGERGLERSLFAHVQADGAALHRVSRGPIALLAEEDDARGVRATSLHHTGDDRAERLDLAPSRSGDVQGLVGLLEQHLVATRAEAGATSEAALDAATRQRLLELGYTGDG